MRHESDIRLWFSAVVLIILLGLALWGNSNASETPSDVPRALETIREGDSSPEGFRGHTEASMDDISIPGICIAHGVKETQRIQPHAIEGFEMTFEEVQEACAPAIEVVKVPVWGCTLFHVRSNDPTAYAYWTAGDRCTMIHELCHAYYITGHTEEFTRRYWSKDPYPACPPK